jgi:hypothetical protein
MLGGPTLHRLVARADVTQLGPESWSVHVTTDVDGTQGERTLEADSCTSLAKATALILAWAVDPVQARATLAANRAEPATAPLAAAPLPDGKPAAPPSPSAFPFAAVIAVSGMGDMGTLPSLGGGAQLALAALIGAARFELSGGYWFPQDATKQENGRNGVTVGSRIHLSDAALHACFRGRLHARFELDPCAGASIVHASGDGYAVGSTSFVPATNTGDWVALQGDVLGAWRIVGPFALRASVGVELTPARPPFTVMVQGSQEVLHQPALVGGTGTLGVEAHFP